MTEVTKIITFRNILLFTATLYVVSFFMSGQLLTQLPTNWFITWLSGIFRLMDVNGFFNVWSGHSPGMHYFYFMFWKPAQALAGGQLDVAVVFSLFWFALTIGGVFLSAFFFYKIAAYIHGETKATILGTVFLVLFLTFEWYVVFDSVTIAALLGAIYYSFKGMGKTAGILLGISTVLKPIALILLPVFIRSEFMSRKTKINIVVSSVASTALLFLPFMIGNFKIFMSSFNWQSGRPPWESVYSFAMWLLNKPVPQNPLFQDYSGLFPTDWGWSGITPIHSVMTTPVPSYGTWYNIVFIGLLALAFIGFLVFKKVRDRQDMIWGSLFMMSAYFVACYGWSVQFFYWLAPFILICLPMWITLSFKVLAWVEYPLFYGLYLARTQPDMVTSILGMPVAWTVSLSSIGIPGFWTAITLRTLLILVLAVVSLNKIPVQAWQPVSKLAGAHISWLTTKSNALLKR